MTSPSGGSRVGTRFGPYELRAVIGAGGMGEVYRAYDTVRDRMVAVKLLRPELAADPVYQERFRRESRLAARLQEPHVIPVHDFGDIDGVLYIDMRLVDGASLKDILQTTGALEPARATSIIKQVAAALDAAHADGLIHRDIKPENVLLTADDFAYLVDFGIAYAGGEASVTMTGVLIGSSAYMAPERFSSAPVGPASDIYSLTCLLYECLTGRPPYEGGDLRQLMSAHLFGPPPRPSIMRRGLSRAFDDVIAKGMAKQPPARYPSASALAAAAMDAAADTGTGAAMAPHGAGSAAPVAGAAAPQSPPSTRQFSQLYPHPEATGYTPYPQPPVRSPQPAASRPQTSRLQYVVVALTVVLFGVAGGLAAALVFGNPNSSPPEAPVAVPPAVETTAPTTSPTSPTTTTTTTTTQPPTTTTPTSPTTPLAAVPGADEQGFVGHAARCDPGSSPAAMVRTDQSLAVVCESEPGQFYYRGERLRDGATIDLGNAQRVDGGFDAIDPTNGARYEVRPDRLTIVSNGQVDTSEPVQQYAAR